jgi:hypothetical protein
MSNPITDGIEMANKAQKNTNNGMKGCLGTIALMSFLLLVLAIYLASIVGGLWFIYEKIFG